MYKQLFGADWMFPISEHHKKLVTLSSRGGKKLVVKTSNWKQIGGRTKEKEERGERIIW